MLRPYSDRDLDQLLDVWYRASHVAHPFLSEDFFERERLTIAEQWIPMAETTVFEADDRVVGFLSLIDNEVGAIFVDPDLHRHGIGRALMDHARDSRLYLEVSVFEANALGRAFYAGYGFGLVKRLPEGSIGLPELRLRLGEPGTVGD